MTNITALVFAVMSLFPCFCGLPFFSKNTWKTTANFLTPQNEEKFHAAHQSLSRVPNVYEDLFAGIEHHPWGVFVHWESNELFMENVEARDPLGFTALQIATIENSMFAAKALIRYGVNVNEVDPNFKTALHLAAMKNHIEIARMLIQVGGKLSHAEEDNNGNTALHIAAMKNHVEIARMLIQRYMHFELDSRNNHDNTALHIATNKNHVEIVRMLIQSDTFYNMPDSNANTALHIAAMKNYIEITRMLVEAGPTRINPNPQDNNGNTALHHAAMKNHVEIARLLIQAGINLYAQNKIGKTALDLANNSEIGMLLLNAMY